MKSSSCHVDASAVRGGRAIPIRTQAPRLHVWLNICSSALCFAAINGQTKEVGGEIIRFSISKHLFSLFFLLFLVCYLLDMKHMDQVYKLKDITRYNNTSVRRMVQMKIRSHFPVTGYFLQSPIFVLHFKSGIQLSLVSLYLKVFL